MVSKYVELIVEVSVSSISLILFVLFFISIKRNNENIFFSMRSCNLMQITNLSILLNILCLTLSDIFHYLDINNTITNLLSDFYFFFHVITFITLILRYHRIFICCKTNDLGKDDLLQFKFFEAKSYHYEYFYIRMMAGIIFVLTLSLVIFFFTEGEEHSTIFHNLELIIKNDEVLNEKNFTFWIIVSALEIFAYTTYTFLISKSHFNPKVNLPKEIIYLAVINYLYFFYIFYNFLLVEGNDNETKKVIKDHFIYLIPILYNLLIYFVALGLPFLWGKNNKVVINYDLPGELASSMYLFLTKEECFDLFHKFLYNRSNERQKSIFYLDMLINIFKYRMLYFTEQPNDILVDELKNIEINFLDSPFAKNTFETSLLREMKGACEIVKNGGKLKMSLFDPITSVIYEYLEKEFQIFKRTYEFYDLKNELTYETYVRCKLSNYGLIRN